MERIFRRGEKTLKVSARLDGDRIRLVTPEGERVFEWEELGPGDYLLRENGKQRRTVVARDRDDRWLWVEGHIHHLEVASTVRKRGASSSGALVSPMPGRVLKVLVEPGTRVTERQTLVVLEAMKMQYEVAAPRDGVVAAVPVTEGLQVAGGVSLVVLEEETES